MNKKIIFGLLLLAAQQITVAQTAFQKGILNEKTSVPTSLSPIDAFKPVDLRASTLPEALDAAFDNICSASTLKGGFNAAMLLPDGSIWKRAYGVAKEIPATVPLTTDHLMAMGSITKSFVAATLLTMVDDSLLGLDDSIGQYLSSYPNIDGNATIRQLLSHRTGFSDYLEHPATIGEWLNNLDSIWVADTVLNHYVLAPNFPVGTDFSYSNTNYLLAGRIIESITGMPWYFAVRERILLPLGLTHTFAYPWETPGTQPVSNLFFDTDFDGVVEDAQGSGMALEGLYSLVSSAGNLMSTPEDIVKFNKAVHGGNVLKPATFAAMHPANPPQYGLGAFPLDIPGVPNWGHNGDLLYKSKGFYLLDETMSLAVQQNDFRLADDAMPDLIDIDTVFTVLLMTYLDFEPSSSVEDLTQQQGFRVFPNPAADVLNLEVLEQLDVPAQVLISDVTGRLVVSQTIQNKQVTLPIGQLSSGIYTLRVGKFVQKVVIGH